MKRHILFPLVTAFALTVNAQVRQCPTEVTDINKVIFLGDEDFTISRNVSVGNMYYYRPEGFFFSGWNCDLRNPFTAIVPANVPLTFTADNQSGVPRWEYQTKDGASVSNENSITLQLPAGVYTAPKLINAEDDNDFYFPTDKMVAGGKTYEQVTDGKIMDVCAVNYVPEGKVYTLSSMMSTNNPDADKVLAEALKTDNIHTKGFGELFVSPAAMTVSGFEILVNADETFKSMPELLKPAILKFDGTNYIELRNIEDFDVVITDITGLQNMYCAKFKLKEGDMTVEPNTKIIPMVSSENIKFTPMFDGQMRYSSEVPNATTMFLDAETSEGQAYMQLNGFAVNDGTSIPRFVNSWCIALNMSYENSDPSGIESITSDNVKSQNIYDLTGRNINTDTDNLPNGLYIVNGKKQIISR